MRDTGGRGVSGGPETRGPPPRMVEVFRQTWSYLSLSRVHILPTYHTWKRNLGIKKNPAILNIFIFIYIFLYIAVTI